MVSAGLSVPASATNGREVGALGQVLGELEAGAGRRRIGIDGVVEQPEAVLVAQLLILAADVGDLAQVERQPQRIQRRPPQLAVATARGRARPAHRPRPAGCRRADRRCRPRSRPAPGRRSARSWSDGLIWKMVRASRSQLPLSSGAVAAIWPRICRPVRKSLRLKAASASLRSVAGDFADRPRLALDLGFQLDRGVSEIVALEGLVGGQRRAQAKRQRGADSCGANQTDHGEAPCADRRRVTNKNARNGDGLMAAEQA